MPEHGLIVSRMEDVAVVDFRDPVGSNREHAREIALALGLDVADLRALEAERPPTFPPGMPSTATSTGCWPGTRYSCPSTTSVSIVSRARTWKG